MSYTLLRVSEFGVVLWEGHCERLGIVPEIDTRLHATLHRELLARGAGVYAVRVDGGAFTIESRQDRRWPQAIAWSTALSPLFGGTGLRAKADVLSLYADLRTRTGEVLCTDGSGDYVYETARASVFAWDGARVIAPPIDAPRVSSVGELALRDAYTVSCRPLRVDGDTGALFVLNAVRGPGRLQGHDVPEHVFDAINEAFALLEA